MSKTTVPSKAPQRVSIAVRVTGTSKPAFLAHGKSGVLVTGRVNLAKGEAGTYTVTTAYGVFDILPTEKITYDTDPMVAVDVHKCGKHGTAMKVYPDGHFDCPTCWHEYTKARREGIKDGSWSARSTRSDAAKAARTERVLAVNQKRESDRARDMGAAIRSSVRAAEYGKGSKAEKDSWLAANLTRIVDGFRISIEEGANLAGIDPWERRTFSEHRKAFPPKSTTDEQADAA